MYENEVKDSIQNSTKQFWKALNVYCNRYCGLDLGRTPGTFTPQIRMQTELLHSQKLDNLIWVDLWEPCGFPFSSQKWLSSLKPVLQHNPSDVSKDEHLKPIFKDSGVNVRFIFSVAFC